LPQNSSIAAHIVEYTRKTENNNGKLHLSRLLNLDFLLVETRYYPSLRTFFESVRKEDEGQIVLQPGATAARN
jgi:hypothetical protein